MKSTSEISDADKKQVEKEILEATPKSGDEFTVPVALTVFWLKRDGKWIIVQYHN
jgi:hypothetical protein